MSSPAAKSALLLILLCGVALSASGCQKALFPENSDRTQYDRYRMLRGQMPPMNQENAFGGNEPALWERLKPLGTP
jgi:hypothetical protein